MTNPRDPVKVLLWLVPVLSGLLTFVLLCALDNLLRSVAR